MSLKWFLEMKYTPVKDAVNIVCMTTKDLEYHTDFLDKTMAGFGKMDFNVERKSYCR